MNRRSLTFRLVLWYCGLLLFLGAAFAFYTYADFDRYIAQTTGATLASRADAVWEMSAGLLDDPDALAALIERRFAPEAQNRFIRIEVAGREVYRSGAPLEHGFDPAAIPAMSAATSPRIERHGNVFLYIRRFALPDGRSVTVESGSWADGVVAAEGKLATSLLFGLPLLLVFAAGGGYLLVKRALAPVTGMIEAAEALTFNSPHNRLPLAGTGDHIDALGRSLNRMLERLDNAYQHSSRFSADAAHELRTPLSIMRGELELLASRRGLPSEVQIAVGTILEETARLGQIVENLIALSRLDSTGGKRTHRPVDLGALAAETIDQMRLMAEDKNILIQCEDGPAVFAAGDRDRLKQVLVNLLDNAIKYTAPGGQVRVAVSAIGKSAILTVTDTGIGIAPESAPLIFDRFFRAVTDRGAIGAGLGLAIVRSICAAHGGAVTVDSAPGVGSAFRVELPHAPIYLVAASARAGRGQNSDNKESVG